MTLDVIFDHVAVAGKMLGTKADAEHEEAVELVDEQDSEAPAAGPSPRSSEREAALISWEAELVVTEEPPGPWAAPAPQANELTRRMSTVVPAASVAARG
jgi:hypothetical protein